VPPLTLIAPTGALYGAVELGSASAVDWNGYPLGIHFSCEHILASRSCAVATRVDRLGRGRGARAVAASDFAVAPLIVWCWVYSLASPQGVRGVSPFSHAVYDAPPRPSRVMTLEWTLVSPPHRVLLALSGVGALFWGCAGNVLRVEMSRHVHVCLCCRGVVGDL
jgi:hypothetical protein